MNRMIQAILLLVIGAAAMAADSGRSSQANAAAPNIPEGARWTIFCTSFSGPGHMEQARRFRDQMVQQTKLVDFHVVQNQDHSTLYYGYYREIDAKVDAKEAARAAADRRTMADFTNSATGERLFRGVLIVAMDEADPVAPAEWNLKNAKGYWSLQVAAFRDNSRRKEAAVEAVRDLRKQGYDAYYFHGPAVSSVCIGAFPQSSVVVDDGPEKISPEAAVLVAPAGVPLPQGQMLTDKGQPLVAKQRRLNVTDPELLKLWRTFPNHATNYEEGRQITRRDGTKVDKVERSFLVVVPREEVPVAAQRPAIPEALLRQAGSAGADPSTPAGAAPLTVGTAQDAPRPVTPKPVQPAGKPAPGGKLRGLDDY